MGPSLLRMKTLGVGAIITASASVHTAIAFHLPSKTSLWNRAVDVDYTLNLSRSTAKLRRIHPRCNICHKGASKLAMVRNIDLPEALVFYGIESMMEPYGYDNQDQPTPCALRPGISRLLNECQEVGTAALLLSEEVDAEEDVKFIFQKACEHALDSNGKGVMNLVEGDDPVLSFRTSESNFVLPANDITDGTSADSSDDHDESIEFYNLQANGRSPGPAFLLDSLRSVHIDPRGFGGSSGFGRGQWIEPRRSPMPARTVVFIAGDRSPPGDGQGTYEEEESSRVKDRCAAARAAGTRIIYLEHLPDQAQPNVAIKDDSQTMSLCDAVIDTFGNDNPRDLQPITLDAISTPGDYWLNPPSPRDDVGNAVAADEIVEWFRSEREMDDLVGDQECIVSDEVVTEEEMSEEEMNKILADLDGL